MAERAPKRRIWHNFQKKKSFEWKSFPFGQCTLWTDKSVFSYTEPINPFHEGFQGATAYNTETQTYTYGDVIQLSSTLYNPDNDYNPIGSYFRCPVEGIYLVAMTLYRDNLYPLRVCVEKTGFLVPIMHVESRTEVSSTSILSNSVLVRCSPGEDISVTATGDGSVKVTNDWVMNTMSVMLMHEDGEFLIWFCHNAPICVIILKLTCKVSSAAMHM